MNAAIARTASGKEAALVAFYDQLDRDGMTLGDLAAISRVGRCHLTELLHGRRTGRNTWKHVIPLLSNEAVFLLKQCSAWNSFAEDIAKECGLGQTVEGGT